MVASPVRQTNTAGHLSDMLKYVIHLSDKLKLHTALMLNCLKTKSILHGIPELYDIPQYTEHPFMVYLSTANVMVCPGRSRISV